MWRSPAHLAASGAHNPPWILQFQLRPAGVDPLTTGGRLVRKVHTVGSTHAPVAVNLKRVASGT